MTENGRNELWMDVISIRPIAFLTQFNFNVADDGKYDDDAVMLEIEGEKVIKGKNQDETGVLTGI